MLADKVRKLLANTRGIKIVGERAHMKASERYLDVTFAYSGKHTWSGAIPVVYPRWGMTGHDPQKAAKFVREAREALQPDNAEQWVKRECERWRKEHSRKKVTKPIFKKLLLLEWQCPRCNLPRNSNPQRRIQSIKDMGYMLATSAQKACPNCGKSVMRFALIPIDTRRTPGYETISPKLRARIIQVLESYDAYEGKKRPGVNLLPDHKFPEIAWDADTPQENPDDMTDDEIRAKFQLLDNRRNLEKREACRRVAQTRNLGTLFGIEHYLGNGPSWPKGVPMTGAKSEAGWRLCPWYDIEAWRRSLNTRLRKQRKK